jgi:methyltransferase family protein
MLLSSWLWAARARRLAQRALRPLGPIDATLAEHAPGHSFADIGALWGVHGRTAFLAEEQGATAVTAVDVSGRTPEFDAEHRRRDSSVRFVQGDVHQPETLEQIGRHDVVWCSGVLYHCPNPIETIECLRSITGSVLVLISATVPELPGKRNAGIFFPGLPERQRRAYDRAYNATIAAGDASRLGLTTPFDPSQGFANWWWGLSPSAIEGMLESCGLTVVETKTNGFHTRVVARTA